jgi:hypothetical protein
MADAVARLRRFSESGGHTHWPDDVSILQMEAFDPSHLAGHRELTNVYLLGLAVLNEGTFATFDRSVRTSAVSGFQTEHLKVLPVDS